MPSTLLGSIVNKLESGGSTIDGPAGGYANYAYQQFPGFVQQYGSSEAGVLNYASQVLKANPNATFGDFYGGYVTGTGNPANASVTSLLTTTQPGAQGAYQNMITNAGISPNTPLANLLGPSSVPAGAGNASSGVFAGSNLDGLSGGNIGDGFGDPNPVNPSTFTDRFNASNPNIAADGSLFGGGATNTDLFSSSNPTSTFGPGSSFGPSSTGFDPSISNTPAATSTAPAPGAIGNPAGDPNPAASNMGTPTGSGGAAGTGTPIVEGLQAPLVQKISDWINNIESAFGGGLKTALAAGGNAVANYFGGITNWFVRAFLIILGIVLVAVGLLKLTGGDKIVIETAKGALAAA